MLLPKVSKLAVGSLLASSLLFLVTGCGHQSNLFSPSCDQPCPPANECAPACQDMCTTYVKADHYHFEKSAPRVVAEGVPFEYVYTLTPTMPLADIVIKDTIPEGATLVATMPEATIDGNQIMWTFPSLPCQPVCLRAKVIPETVTCLQNCASVHAIPVACGVVHVCKPQLEIYKSCQYNDGMIGCSVDFRITVCNKGNFPAYNVIVTDVIPDGLSHPSGQKEVRFNAGTLAPGQSYTCYVRLILEAGGDHCNVARVTASNVKGSQEAEACITCIVPPPPKCDPCDPCPDPCN